MRVTDPGQLQSAEHAKAYTKAKEFQAPVIVKFILDRATNMVTGTEIDKISEFEDLTQGAAVQPRWPCPIEL